MKNTAILSILFLLFNLTCAYSQDEGRHCPVSMTIIKEVESATGNKYELIVTLPANYNKEKDYKVLYYLDAWWLSELVMGSYRVVSISKEIEDLILVGISIAGNEESWNTQRNMDYTPSGYDKEKMKISMKAGTVELKEETTGGAEEFIHFMKTVVFDEVESTYNIDKKARGFLGHSFGGLFGYYCLIKHGEIFKNYILISPSLWWNKSEFLSSLNIKKSKENVSLYLVVGGAESKMLISPIRKVADELKEVKTDKIRFESKEYEGMDHHSILPTGIFEGINFIYKKG